MLEETFPPESLEAQAVDVLKTCYDPEIPVDIFEMGLIYKVEAPQPDTLLITMTLTSPACPVAGTLPPEIQQRLIDEIDAVQSAQVEVVWDPPWNMDMMSEAAKLQLGMM